MPALEIAVKKLEPILQEFSIQLRDVEAKISQKGTISSDICSKCSQKNIAKVLKFGHAAKSLASFLVWIRENEIRDLASNGEILSFRSTKKIVEGAKGSIPLLEMGQALGASTEKVLYDYRLSVGKLTRKDFAELVKHSFSSIRMCPHISEVTAEKHLALVSKAQHRLDFEGRGTQRVEELWEEPDLTNRYMILCSDCYERIDSIGCEESIRREGFVFVHRCPIRKIILQNLLEKHSIKFVSGEEERIFERDQPLLYLPELSVFVSGSSRDPATGIESLKPESLLAFGSKQELPNYLHFGTNVILFDTTVDNKPLIVFDRDLPLESSEERIIEKILSDLDQYSSEIRGKEHDKLVEAFRKIGEELGYVTQAEMSQKGARVDMVWLSRNGKVEVAIEVETSAQWKKDIVTTWETSPKLAVVLAHYKTDKGTEDITRYNLLQYMPHKLLFISYLQKKRIFIKGDGGFYNDIFNERLLEEKMLMAYKLLEFIENKTEEYSKKYDKADQLPEDQRANVYKYDFLLHSDFFILNVFADFLLKERFTFDKDGCNVIRQAIEDRDAKILAIYDSIVALLLEFITKRKTEDITYYHNKFFKSDGSIDLVRTFLHADKKMEFVRLLS